MAGTHAVILAGGSGTRLWPLTRRQRPKQLLRLFEGASLLQLARRRLENLFEPHQIYVVTSAAYVDMVAGDLPDIPRENLIGEPMGRDTANAIGLTAHLLALRDPEGTMAVFTADHLISPLHVFADSLRTALAAAEAHPASLVTFGITPDQPHTGYGYIHRGPQVAPKTYRVLAFREKPTAAAAQQYLDSGEYFWNSGMFCWKLRAILGELERSLPENHAALRALARDWAQRAGSGEFAARFAELRPISIDFGVMEKAQDVLVVEMPCRWLDMGSFSALATTMRPDDAGNVVIGSKGLSISGGENILVSENDHLVVTLGLSGVVVVHSPEVTLVCDRAHEQKIRDLVHLCRERYGEKYE